MLTQEITYKDHNGNTRTERLFFNLTVMDVVDLELESTAGGLQEELQTAIDGKDYRDLLAFVKKLITRSYGIKSEDGRRHDKSPQITQDFQNSAYYSDFLMGLFENGGTKGVEFIKGVLPTGLIQEAVQKINNQEEKPVSTQGQPETAANAKERWDARQAAKNIPAPTVDRNWESEMAGFTENATPTPVTVAPVDSAPRTPAPDPEQPIQLSPEEYARFKAFQEQQGQLSENAPIVGRPPHESGPGSQYNG